MTVTLIDRIAAMPSAGGKRTSAFITNVENAKKTPAINPQPSVEMSVNPNTTPRVIGMLLVTTVRSRHCSPPLERTRRNREAPGREPAEHRLLSEHCVRPGQL